MNCENHLEREGALAVDLPSINIRRYLCEECRSALIESLSQFKGKREAWEERWTENDERDANRTFFGGSVYDFRRDTERKWK